VRVRVEPGARIGGDASVPGDKSIAHRWLILAATGIGRSRLVGLPPSLDVVSTARCLAELSGPGARPSLETWASSEGRRGNTSSLTVEASVAPGASGGEVMVVGAGRDGLIQPTGPLECGNSGTTMRLLAGMVAAAPFNTVLTGDESLNTRPMERVAAPLREMGATVTTTDGHPPMEVEGTMLWGISYRAPIASAQVKGAVLLAGVAADGETEVIEPAATRDHTERALEALGAPVRHLGLAIGVSRFQHGGFEASVPGDISSAAYILVAGAMTDGSMTIRDVGLNPSRTHFLTVLGRMGIGVRQLVTGAQLGEPVGELELDSVGDLAGTVVTASELPLVIDEVPVLAAAAAHATGETRFAGAGELAVKESDRLAGLARVLKDLGGEAEVEGEDLVIGGGGLDGGTVDSLRDHRIAMAAAVACLRARSSSEIEGIESAGVSFPGFLGVLRGLGARIERA
jgi:3-phosphoshikimate 1-carboxyvinyltransferase